MDGQRNSEKAFLYAVIIIVSSIVLYSVPSLHAGQVVKDASDLDPETATKRLAECESVESKFRADLAQLRPLWGKRTELLKQLKPLDQALADAKRRFTQADDAYEEALQERSKLQPQCWAAWKASGIPAKQWEKRWHEVQECRRWTTFENTVLDKRGSNMKAANVELKNTETKRNAVYREFDKIDLEYSAILYKYTGLAVSWQRSRREKGPDALLGELAGECDKLRVLNRKFGYDAAVRAQKATTECKFPEAEKYIGQLRASQEKETLRRNLADARAREVKVKEIYQAGKDIYNRGRSEEQAGRYDSARALYQDALNRFRSARDMSRCEDRMPTIFKALSATQERIAEVAGRQPPRQQRAEQRFDKPMVGGVPLDYCQTWATNCGKPAADYFCIKNHFSGAVRWETSRVQQTRIMSTNELCQVGKNSPICDAFSYIICK